jgi:hypothetical protein
LNALFKNAKLVNPLTTKLAAANAHQRLAQQAKNSFIFIKTQMINLRLQTADVSAPIKNSLATSTLIPSNANANAHLTTAHQDITSTQNIASVLAKTPPPALLDYFGTLLLVAVNVIQQLLKIFAIQISTLTLKVVFVFAHLPKMVAKLVQSGMTMSALASAAQWSAPTTSTGTTSTVSANANPSPVKKISTGTIARASVNV